ncbi:hypothetical protein M0802_013891 [Mischocyttarus mexicanus]|nr:hypothetical protein M0802_013891 [Mischocyttarus mexicanus]
MEKLMFEFRMKGSTDGKTTIPCVTSISTPRGQTYSIPEHLQPLILHTGLAKSQEATRVKKALKKRNQFKKIWIPLTEELSETYMDKVENLIFEDEHLDEKTEEDIKTIDDIKDERIRKLMEKLLEEKKQNPVIRNLNEVAKEFIIDKFDGKNLNASQWLEEFEKECERFRIREDSKKIEILKFFLEKTSIDWYTCMLLKYSVESRWGNWKEDFCESFESKNWFLIESAYTFKYQTGTLQEYAMKKERLLLQVRKSIDTHTLIDLIVIGLPGSVKKNINRGTIENTKDLCNELNRLEGTIIRKKNYTSSRPNQEDRTACKICEKKNKKHFHAEENCWFKDKTGKPSQVRSFKNNTILNIEIYDTDPGELNMLPLKMFKLRINDKLDASAL